MLNKRSDKVELLRIAEAVALEKSIDKEIIITSMESAIQKAAKTRFGSDNDIRAIIDRESGDISLHKVLKIVESPENLDTEISLKGNVLKIEIQSNGNPWDEHAIFDIHVKYPHGDSYKHFIENNTHFCPKDFLDSHEYYQYKNFNLRVPSRVNDYLSLIYGDKWIVPADYWSGSSYGNILKSDISSSGN